MATSSRITDHPTAESITQARDQMEQERQRVYEQTGLRVTDHGVQHPPTIIHCPRPGCLFTATARNEGRAVRALSAHLVHHIRKEQGQ